MLLLPSKLDETRVVSLFWPICAIMWKHDIHKIERPPAADAGDEVSDNISETVQDGDMVAMEI